jgi:hypothetical protein
MIKINNQNSNDWTEKAIQIGTRVCTNQMNTKWASIWTF